MARERILIAACVVLLLAGCRKAEQPVTEPEPVPPATLDDFRKAFADNDVARVRAALRQHPEWTRDDLEASLSLLHVAALEGNEPMVALLLANGADVNAREGFQDKTPLHYAMGNAPVIGLRMSPSAKVVQLLIDRGADVNATDNEEGETPLFEAPSGEIVRILIAHGANPNATNRWDDTPLCRLFEKDVAEALIAGGANVNHKGMQGNTPLHYVAGVITLVNSDGKTEKAMAELLISKGADVNLRDHNGKTPLRLALERHKSGKVAEILRRHGAKE